MIPKNPFENLVLDEEELQIKKDIADGLYSPVSEEEQKILFAKFKQASKNRQSKKTISIRVNPHIISMYKAEALRTGIPYQTLMTAKLTESIYAMRAA